MTVTPDPRVEYFSGHLPELGPSCHAIITADPATGQTFVAVRRGERHAAGSFPSASPDRTPDERRAGMLWRDFLTAVQLARTLRP